MRMGSSSPPANLDDEPLSPGQSAHNDDTDVPGDWQRDDGPATYHPDYEQGRDLQSYEIDRASSEERRRRSEPVLDCDEDEGMDAWAELDAARAALGR